MVHRFPHNPTPKLKARNQGGIGAELEHALFCLDECIDRAKAFAALAAKEIASPLGKKVAAF